MKDITHKVKIASLGVYLPPTVVSSAELDRQWGLREGTILRLTGVAERRYERSQTSAGMAAEAARAAIDKARSEEHTSELQSLRHLVCRLLLEKKKTQKDPCPGREKLET